ncbi:MAG: preprotein translocase subunit YajC [Coriobacteriia bacterium]|nr:preprotein translocase subunit YajC [Coriobacteriia bacterium]
MAMLAMGAPPSGGEGSSGGATAMVGQIVMIAAILVIMYMLMIRPQRKRDKQRREMIDAVKEKDQVVTIGGIHGKVVAIKDRHLILELGKGVTIRIDKAAISRVIPPGEEDKGEDA